VDAAHPDPAAQLQTVRDVIGDVGARDITEIVVFNKADLVDDDTRMLLRGLEPRALFASSRSGEGIDELRAAIEAALPMPAVEIRALVPYDRGDLVSAAHESGIIVSQTHEAGGTALHAHVSERLAAEFATLGAYELSEPPAEAHGDTPHARDGAPTRRVFLFSRVPEPRCARSAETTEVCPATSASRISRHVRPSERRRVARRRGGIEAAQQPCTVSVVETAKSRPAR
jgi:hypothetical protein